MAEGGTLVTVRGSGFDVMPANLDESVRCRWGSIYAEGNDTAAENVTATEIICRSSQLPEGLQNLSIALNGQQFFATNLRLLVYPQPTGFSQAALNTSDLGVGPPKYYGALVGAPLGEIAFVWIRGNGFLAFQNASTALEFRQLRCRWGAPDDDARQGAPPPVTAPTRVEDDLVICPAAVGTAVAEVRLFLALTLPRLIHSPPPSHSRPPSCLIHSPHPPASHSQPSPSRLIHRCASSSRSTASTSSTPPSR